LGELNFSQFVELVVKQGVRPERPDDEDAPHLSDAIWDLAENCWVKEPKHRPTAGAVCDAISNLLDLQPSHRIACLKPLPLPPTQVQATPPDQSSQPPNLTIQHTEKVYCATFSPDGKYIVSGSNCKVCIWDVQTGNLALEQMYSDCVACAAFSHDGRHIVTGFFDYKILVWDPMTGKVVAGPFKGHTNTVWSVCFSPTNSRIVSGSRDQTIRIWDAQTGSKVAGPLKGHTAAVHCAVFSGDGQQIASGSRDESVRVWDAKSGRLIHGPLHGHTDTVHFVAFSTDGRRIVSVSWGGNACVWDVGTGALVFKPLQHHAERVFAVAFTANSTQWAVSPDGKWITGHTGDDWRTVQVWDSQTGQLAVTLSGHTKDVCSISFSPDSKQILSVSLDKTIQVRTIDW
jgi:WD40 repeat protein